MKDLQKIAANVQDEHKEYGFPAPSEKELSELDNGSIVKIKVEGENFWTVITRITKEGEVTATVVNELVRTERHGVKYQDQIVFHLNNVWDIEKKKQNSNL
jgi:hypothetical protein